MNDAVTPLDDEWYRNVRPMNRHTLVLTPGWDTNVPGLVVTQSQDVDGEWVVTHADSGTLVPGSRSREFADAVAFAQALRGPDWTRPQSWIVARKRHYLRAISRAKKRRVPT